MMSALGALALVAATLWHSGPQQAQACRCVGLPSSEEEVRVLVEASEAVIVGEMITYLPAPPDDPSRGPGAEVRVLTEYKGSGATTVTVEDITAWVSCGYPPLLQGGRHLMVLNRYDGMLRTSSCSAFPMDALDDPQYGETGTHYQRFLDRVTEIAPPRDLVAAGPPAASPEQAPVAAGGDSGVSRTWARITVGVAVGLVIGAVGAYVARHRRA
jgi:hypothetical protein